jgi:hypothetical protein
MRFDFVTLDIYLLIFHAYIQLLQYNSKKVDVIQSQCYLLQLFLMILLSHKIK